MRLLFDVNVWVALAIANHPHHDIARTYFDDLTAESTVYFCRTTQQGFLRLITETAVVGTAAVSNELAWQGYLALRHDPRVEWLDEAEGLEERWSRHARRPTRSPRVWMDAYLAAMAQLNGLHLVTFDKGFRAYENLDWIDLGAAK